MEIYVTLTIAVIATAFAIVSHYIMTTTPAVDNFKQNLLTVLGYISPTVLLFCVIKLSGVSLGYHDVIDAQARTISNIDKNNLDKQELNVLRELKEQYSIFINEYHDLAFLPDDGFTLIDDIMYNEYKLDSLKMERKK